MRTRRIGAAALCVGVLLATVAPIASMAAVRGEAAAAEEPDIRLNDIQVKGSHNSYHVEQPPDIIDIYFSFVADAYLLAYSHDPLTTQFEEQGVRQIELDVFYDADGDLYRPLGTPGFKVFHIETIDEDSTCELLVDCLAEIESWTRANPRAVPITVLLEMKDTDDIPGAPTPDPIDAAALHALDAEIRTVLSDDQMVTPDFLRGVGRSGGADGSGTVYDDPESAVLGYGWPRLDDVRGRTLFVLDNERNDYVDGDPTLSGRVAFPPSSPGNPDAAFLKLNDSIGDQAAIESAVDAGYIVRTRADFPVETGLTGDSTNREAALVGGAQFVSGDYLTPTDYARYDATFAARFNLAFDPARPAYETIVPGGTPARCNPRTAPAGCTSQLIEDLTTCSTPFPDVLEAHPFCVDIDWAAASGVTDGYADGTYRPAIAVTRQATAAYLYRLAGSPDFSPPGTPTYPDVPASHPFFVEIEWATAEGIATGFPDGTFRSTGTVTRQAAAAFLHRMAGSPVLPLPDPATFSDVPAGHPFDDEIEWAAAEEIARGFTDGTYRPTGVVTRQAFAAFAHRFSDAGLVS